MKIIPAQTHLASIALAANKHRLAYLNGRVESIDSLCKNGLKSNLGLHKNSQTSSIHTLRSQFTDSNGPMATKAFYILPHIHTLIHTPTTAIQRRHDPARREQLGLGVLLMDTSKLEFKTLPQQFCNK